MDRRRNYLELVQPICEFCGKPFKANAVKECHHGGQHDTQGANQKWPRFTQSLMNKMLGCEWCHKNNPGKGRVPDWVADEYEVFLTAYEALIEGGVKVNLNLVGKELEITRDEIITGRKG